MPYAGRVSFCVAKNIFFQGGAVFTIGQKSLDKDWEDYVSTLKDKGLNTILGFYQTQYDVQ